MTTPDQAPQKEAPSPYIEGTLIQNAFDSTSLGYAMSCPRQYFYAQLRGLRRKKIRTTITFGQAFHKAMETWQLTKAVGDAHAAADKVVAEAGGMDEHKSRTPESLHRSIDAYLARHAAEEMETLTTTEGKPAVELHFNVPLGRVEGIGDVTYCGYIDRAVKFQETPYVLDHKTTGQSISTEKGSASYFGSFTPDNQFTGYCFGAREAFGFPVRGVILDAMQIAKTKVEFARNVIHRTPAQVEEWRQSALATIKQITGYARDGKEPKAENYLMNTKACHSRYGACTYAGICGRDPAVRERFLETDFEVRPWNPLALRNSGTLDVVGQDDAASDD